MEWHQYYLIGYSLLFTFSFVIKTIVQRARTGIDPYRFNKSSSPQQRFLQRYGSVVNTAWLVIVIGYAIDLSFMERVGFPLFWQTPALRNAALFASFIFLVGLVTAQWQMGNNWRVGIDEENRTELITTGFFRYSRNPVFGFTLAGLASITIAYPGSTTFLLWWMSFSGLYWQALEEEAFLLKQHGREYEHYKEQTGRFLPRFLGAG